MPAAGLSGFSAYFVSLVRHSPRRFALACALNLVTATLAGAGMLILIPMLRYAGWVDGGNDAGLVGGILKLLPSTEGRVSLAVTLGLFVAVIALVGALEYWRQSLSGKLEHDYLFTLRSRLNASIAACRWPHLLTRKLQSAQHMVIVGMPRIAALTHYSLTVVSSGLLLGVYLVLCLMISFWLTAFTATSAALLFLLYRKRRAQWVGRQSFTADQDLQADLARFLDGIKLAKGHDLGDAYVRRFDALLREEQGFSRTYLQMQAKLQLTFNVMAALLFCLTFGVAVRVMHLEIATMLVMLLLFARLMPKVSELLQMQLRIANLLPVHLEMREMLADLEAHREPTAAAGPAPSLTRAIRLENVTFAYPGRTAGLFSLSCVIPANATTAIIGPSGSGKTTLADLLMGLLTPATGSLYIDDTRLDETRAAAWRTRTGYVPQDAYLFNDTVRANLAWVDPDVGEDRMWEALENAAAADFVRRLPQGLDTPVSDKGGNLSGGERQRLALARALLRKPEVLILDEATSALDAANEESVYKALRRLHGSVTIIFISHRPSALELADQVVSLQDGRTALPA